MNPNYDKFSLKRMWAVTTHYCVANGRKLLVSSFVIFAMTFLISLLITKMTGNDDGLDSAARAAMLGIMYLFIIGLGSTIIGSLTFSSYSSKPKRISAMMLPAKKSEKFLSMLIVYIVFGNIVLFGSIFLSEWITASMYGLNSAFEQFRLSFWYTEPKLRQFVPLIFWGAVCYVLIPQAIYLLGSALWPRLSFLKTAIAMSIFQLLLTIIMPISTMSGWINPFLEFMSEHFDSPEAAYNSICFILVCAYLLLAGIYVLAWLRFRNLAVAKRFLS